MHCSRFGSAGRGPWLTHRRMPGQKIRLGLFRRVIRHRVKSTYRGGANSGLNEPIHSHFSFDFAEFSPNLCSRFDKLFRPPAMLEIRRRDPRFAFRGPRSGRQTAVKSAALLAFKRRFLARGAMPSFSWTIFSGHDFQTFLRRWYLQCKRPSASYSGWCINYAACYLIGEKAA